MRDNVGIWPKVFLTQSRNQGLSCAIGGCRGSFNFIFSCNFFMATWPLGEAEVCTHSSNQSDHIVLMHLSVHCSTVAVARSSKILGCNLRCCMVSVHCASRIQSFWTVQISMILLEKYLQLWKNCIIVFFVMACLFIFMASICMFLLLFGLKPILVSRKLGLFCGSARRGEH